MCAKDILLHFQDKVKAFAAKFNEMALIDPRNDISFALSLDGLPAAAVTRLGSNIFYKCVSGPRVVQRDTVKNVCGIQFQCYGAHCNDYPQHYLAMACAIGVRKSDIDVFMKRLEKAYADMRKAQLRPPVATSASQPPAQEAGGEPIGAGLHTPSPIIGLCGCETQESSYEDCRALKLWRGVWGCGVSKVVAPLG